MADHNYPLTADDGLDDLPRTLRREKEAREREAREREAGPAAFAPGATAAGDFAAVPEPHGYHAAAGGDELFPAVVKRLDVPFFRLMLFFIKAVLAAIPALILLGGILWLAGDLLQRFFPQLVKMQIFIHFPQ